MWIARLTATSPHTHSPAKRQTFLSLDYNVKTDRSDSNLDWNGLEGRIGKSCRPMRDKKLPTIIFGEVLAELRLQQSLTQDQLAERAGTERSHISALERAEKGPALATIFTLADALAVPAGDLIALVEQRLKTRL